MTAWIVGLKIAALGDGALEAAATLTDARYRLATRIPTWDTQSVYRDTLAALPDAVGVSVDWAEGTCSTPGLTLTLRGTPEVYGWLLRPNFARLTTLSSALSASATAVVLDATGLGGRTVTIGREAIRLGTTITGGPGAYSYGGSTRGVLGTSAYAHGGNPTDDIEVFAMGASPLGLLPCEVFRVPAVGGSYADEEVIFRGVLQAPEWDGSDGRGSVRVQIDSALDVIKRSVVCKSIFRARPISSGALAWAAPLSPGPAVDAVPSTPPLRAIMCNGDEAFVAELYGDAQGWGVQLPRQGAERSWAGSTRIPVTAPGEELDDPPDGDLWQLFSTYYNAPAVNDAGDTLSSNALTHLLQILTTTEGGGNGSYDLGVKALAVGVPAALIDIAQIERLRDSRGAGLELRTLHYPVDGRPIKVGDLVSWLLRPFGLVLIAGAGGLLQVRALEDGLGSTATLTTADTLAPPRLAWAGDPVDEVTISFAEVPGQGTVEQVFSDVFTRERNLAGSSTTVEIDARGVEDEAAARLLALQHVTRWRWRIPVLQLETTRALDVWPGDEVTVTLPVLPGRDGARGWTEEVCVVSAREVELASGRHRYDLWWTSAIYNRTGRIGPAARVVSYSAPTLTVDADTFAPAGYADSDAAIWEDLLSASGTILRCLILDSDLSVRGAVRVIAASGSGNTLTLNSPTTAPVAGDVIVLAAYDSWGTATERNYLHARYAYMADATDTVGSGGDDPYEWEG